jgi:hypothetical protein
MQYNTNSNSQWWLKDSLFSNDVDVLTGESTQDKSSDLIKLAGYRRAIANFVNIVTGQNIPVTFKGSDSYTDGERVVLSAALKDSDFDAAVGLALHEGSHIKLTDFDVLRDFINGSLGFNKISQDQISKLQAKYYNFVDDSSTRDYVVSHVKNLLNIIEDRRIDNFIFKSAPGYKGYYHSLYEKYFNAKIIDKALVSGDKRELDWNSYMFRICNITNENRDLNALPGLMDIWNTMDLKNIENITSTKDALDVALKIFWLVEDNLPEPKTSSEEEEEGGGEGEGSEDGNEGQSGGIDPMSNEASDSNDDGSSAEGDEAMKSSGNNPVESELSPRQQKQLDNAIQKQNDFLESNVKKTKMNNSDQNKIKALEESGSEIKKVGKDYSSPWRNQHYNATTDCILIKKLSKNLIDSDAYTFLSNAKWRTEGNDDAISKGVRLGMMLGKKLKLRSEERNTKFSRLESGKIDKRLIASLGYGAERIFSQVMNDKFTPANVHISIDLSGSMSGEKFRSCQTSVVAIAKAASMIDNLDIQVSYRTTSGQAGLPTIMIAYDSRVDNFKKIRSLFKFICPSNLTPEGLCFEAIQNLLVDASGDRESFFINFSDGEPYCNPKGFYYGGDHAAAHTKLQIDKMRKKGIKILSYFISGMEVNTVNDSFRRMYGKASSNVNTTTLIPLTKTLNNLFLTK